MTYAWMQDVPITREIYAEIVADLIRCVAPGASYDVCAAGMSSNVACSGSVGGWPG
jgi:hypothetical protein